MKKINLVGTSGSGKSTTAKMIAEKLSYPYIEMDALFWKPNWQESTNEEFFPKIESALDQPCWVLDGNYGRSTHIKWAQVDTVIWVDYSLPRTLYQAVTRACSRLISQTEMWAGNKESFSKLFSSDSIIWWTIKTYRKNRQKYLRLMSDEGYSHINFIQIRSRKDLKQLMQSLDQLTLTTSNS